jgi:hypothetical protein
VVAILVLLAKAPGCGAQAPAVRMEVVPSQTRVVQGEPIFFDAKITWAFSVALPAKPRGGDPNLSIEWVLPNGQTRSYAAGKRPVVPWDGTPYRPEPKCPEALRIDLWPCDPGPHRVRLRYAVAPPRRDQGDFWKEQVISNWTEFEVTVPQGADALAWEAFRALAPKADCLRFFNWITYPPNDLLSRFPTSTYAGYVLRAPAASFGCSTYDCFEHPEETLRAECDRGGGEEVIRRCMQSERQRMSVYAQAASAFLEAHPDFFDAPRIRRQLVYCLAFTERIPEAMTHVRILARGQGSLAQEAQAYLEKKAAPKCKG